MATKKRAKIEALKAKVKAQEQKVKGLDKQQIKQAKSVDAAERRMYGEQAAQEKTLAKLKVESEKLDGLYEQLQKALDPQTEVSTSAA